VDMGVVVEVVIIESLPAMRILSATVVLLVVKVSLKKLILEELLKGVVVMVDLVVVSVVVAVVAMAMEKRETGITLVEYLNVTVGQGEEMSTNAKELV
ncbi:hypothetical protein, partial [Klebsiella pneumoniae]|uniref:hypothetical protein n=1 Tax=Klebsiella pneumoniae TaxID=573 RepID=UPI003013869D